MAVLGCLFAAMVARVRARELLLPLLTLPLWIPFIVFGGQAVQAAMGGGAGAGNPSGLLIDLDILFLLPTSLVAPLCLHYLDTTNSPPPRCRHAPPPRRLLAFH